MNRANRRIAVQIAGLVAAAGCTGTFGADGAAIVRDSSGIEIVESAAPAWSDGEGWRIGSDPLTTIGMLDGPVEYQLQRVVGAYRTARGQILVGNAGTNEIRVYEADGTFLRAIGRAGGGPGEFARLQSVYLYQDTLYAYDLGQQRISLFDDEGAFVRSFSVAAATGVGSVETVGRFGDGRWVLQRTTYGLIPGLARATSTYSQFSEGDSASITIGSFAGPERIVQPVGPVGAYTRAAPYARRPTTLVAGSDLVYGSAERYEIAVHAADGALRKLIRRNVDPDPISRGDLDLWEAEVEAKRRPFSQSLPAMFHQPISSFELPQTKAAYGSIVIDKLGNYWVADYAFPAQQPTSWSVFAAGGAWLGEVGSPDRFRILEIGTDYVLGVYWDELDVEYVRLYPLLK